MWEELYQYTTMPNCACHMPCTCLATRKANEFIYEEIIIRFLIRLNEEYQGVASDVLFMDLMPQINRVFSLVIQ